MGTPHSHPHKTARKKTPQEIAFAKAQASAPGVGKDGMTAFARKHFIGGSADQAKREKKRVAGFKPSDSGVQISARALPEGYSRQGWAGFSPSQRRMIQSVIAANKKNAAKKSSS